MASAEVTDKGIRVRFTESEGPNDARALAEAFLSLRTTLDHVEMVTNAQPCAKSRNGEFVQFFEWKSGVTAKEWRPEHLVDYVPSTEAAETLAAIRRNERL